MFAIRERKSSRVKKATSSDCLDFGERFLSVAGLGKRMAMTSSAREGKRVSTQLSGPDKTIREGKPRVSDRPG